MPRLSLEGELLPADDVPVAEAYSCVEGWGPCFCEGPLGKQNAFLESLPTAVGGFGEGYKVGLQRNESLAVLRKELVHGVSSRLGKGYLGHQACDFRW